MSVMATTFLDMLVTIVVYYMIDLAGVKVNVRLSAVNIDGHHFPLRQCRDRHCPVLYFH